MNSQIKKTVAVNEGTRRADGIRKCFRTGFPLMGGSPGRDSCVYFRNREEADAWVKKYGHFYGHTFTEAAQDLLRSE